MNWDSIIGTAQNVVEKKMKDMDRSLRNTARSFSDEELLYKRYHNNLSPMAEEILDDEIRRRGL